MKFFIKIVPDTNTAISFSASIIIHLIIFLAAAFTLKISTDKSSSGGNYVQIKTREIINNLRSNNNDKKISGNNNLLKEKTIVKKNISEPKANDNILAFSDTSGLYQIYKESTLDVSMRYPVGWTYIDQDVKNKLDGVTFWAINSVFSPPPYVHLDVKEKYLFSPKRYKYSIITDNYTAYYNDPEELSGQVSQEIYIRTNIDEDFSIKLIMEGMESFKTFQPVFFGMVKTFKFDNSLF